VQVQRTRLCSLSMRCIIDTLPDAKRRSYWPGLGRPVLSRFASASILVLSTAERTGSFQCGGANISTNRKELNSVNIPTLTAVILLFCAPTILKHVYDRSYSLAYITGQEAVMVLRVLFRSRPWHLQCHLPRQKPSRPSPKMPRQKVRVSL
jgi:hypothetical protein